MAWQKSVHHTPTGVYRRGPTGSESSITLCIRAGLDAPVRDVYLRCAPDGEEQTLRAEPVERRAGYACRWWEVTVDPANSPFHYRFLVRTDRGVYWYNAGGISRAKPTYHTDFQLLLGDQELSWLDHTVFYQIFPDRFCMGKPENRVKDGGHLLDGHPVVAKSWGELPNVHQGAREFYGGDLSGITLKLPYLHQELGVNGLYLNPVFTAPSSHRYDVASYRRVDPHLGGETDFLELRESTRERHMKLILDIVPNHCGVEHEWFQAALADQNAGTSDFFHFYQHPDCYESWLGIRSLPKLNYQSEKLKEEMYRGEDAVFKHWLRQPYGIDGWRIDVANMLARRGADHMGHKVLRGIRRAVKSVNPGAYLLGESFFDASSYLQGGQLDASMNYRGFMMPLYHWLTGRDYHHFLGREWGDDYPLESAALGIQWNSFRASIPWSVARLQYNLLGSHDTPRLLTLVEGDRRKASIARLLLFTYPGVPSIYYGDEIGLEGGRDPDNRRCMEWNRTNWDGTWFEGWVELIKLRREVAALRGGSFQELIFEEETVSFLREAPGSRLVVVAKRGEDEVDRLPLSYAAVPDGAVFHEHFSGARATVTSGFLAISQNSTQLWIEQ